MNKPTEHYIGQFRKWMPGYLVTQIVARLITLDPTERAARDTANNSIIKMMKG